MAEDRKSGERSDRPRRRIRIGGFGSRVGADPADAAPPRWRHPLPGTARRFPMRLYGVDWMLEWVEGAEPGAAVADVREDTARAHGPFCVRCGCALEEVRAGYVLAVLPRTSWRCPECGAAYGAWVRSTEAARRSATAQGLAALYPVVKRLGDI